MNTFIYNPDKGYENEDDRVIKRRVTRKLVLSYLIYEELMSKIPKTERVRFKVTINRTLTL
jgi:hypothetical protein